MIPEMHLRQPRFTYNSCRSFSENKERMQKFKEIEDSRYIYQNKLDTAYFQHDMAYWDFNDLTRWTASDKILRDEALNITRSPKYDGYQRGLASMDYNFFDKKASAMHACSETLATENKSASGSGIKNENISNKNQLKNCTNQLLENLRKVHSSSIDNIWGGDLADIQLINKFDKAICFLLCVIYIFSKYVWFIPLKDKKDITITSAFQRCLEESDQKPNKTWGDKGSQILQ